MEVETRTVVWGCILSQREVGDKLRKLFEIHSIVFDGDATPDSASVRFISGFSLDIVSVSPRVSRRLRWCVSRAPQYSRRLKRGIRAIKAQLAAVATGHYAPGKFRNAAAAKAWRDHSTAEYKAMLATLEVSRGSWARDVQGRDVFSTFALVCDDLPPVPAIDRHRKSWRRFSQRQSLNLAPQLDRCELRPVNTPGTAFDFALSTTKSTARVCYEPQNVVFFWLPCPWLFPRPFRRTRRPTSPTPRRRVGAAPGCAVAAPTPSSTTRHRLSLHSTSLHLQLPRSTLSPPSNPTTATWTWTRTRTARGRRRGRCCRC